MSVREQAKDLSNRLSSTWSDISFPIVYREFKGKTVDPTEGTIVSNYETIYTRSYEGSGRDKGIFSEKEMGAGQGVIEKGDVVFRVTENKLTPRSEEDELYKSIYEWGLIGISTGATTVSGSSVNWDDIEPGDVIRFNAQATFHRISSIVNITNELYISEAYNQITLSSATYQIYKTFQIIGFEKRMAQSEYHILCRHI